MANEFIDDATDRLLRAMGKLGISAEVAQMVAANWQAGIMRDWGGDRPYIGKGGQDGLSRRNAAILRDWQAGERYPALARKYGISRARVCQIVNVGGG